MMYYRPPFDILGGRVPPVPRGIYAPGYRRRKRKTWRRRFRHIRDNTVVDSQHETALPGQQVSTDLNYNITIVVYLFFFI